MDSGLWAGPRHPVSDQPRASHTRLGAPSRVWPCDHLVVGSERIRSRMGMGIGSTTGRDGPQACPGVPSAASPAQHRRGDASVEAGCVCVWGGVVWWPRARAAPLVDLERSHLWYGSLVSRFRPVTAGVRAIGRTGPWSGHPPTTCVLGHVHLAEHAWPRWLATRVGRCAVRRRVEDVEAAHGIRQSRGKDGHACQLLAPHRYSAAEGSGSVRARGPARLGVVARPSRASRTGPA